MKNPKIRKNRDAESMSADDPYVVAGPRIIGFAEECQRQSLALRTDANEQITLDYLEAVADTEGWK